MPAPLPPPSDAHFLDAIEGYARCLKDGQEARLSREQLERLALMARRSLEPRTNA
jgi:hypothetical protein